MSALHRSDVVGAWTLRSFVVANDSGTTIAHPLGEDAAGFLLYTEDGYMSAQLMRQDRPAFDVASNSGGSVEQTVAAARGYLAYTGSFAFDEATQRLSHHVAVSLLPNWIGVDQLRDAVLDDELLVLSADVEHEYGGGATATLTWQRPDRTTREPDRTIREEES